MRRSLIAALIVALITAPRVLPGQERGATALRELTDALPNTMRVLLIGAHPDDEDTQLIAWLSRGRHVETAYLSLTRGDGGQNLIGNELGEALGVIRTEELLAARRVDGAKQFFARAYDFGFSKSAEEAFAHWPHDTLLADVVTVVRQFRPHVIVAVFSGTPRDGHGQHQVSGIVAREAYDLAGDATKFPARRTAGAPPWQPLKFYRAARFNPDGSTLRFNVGEYSPLLGRSYAEIAGESRSQHKSQAFGALQRKGVIWDYVRREATRVMAPADPRAERSMFDGIDTTWGRFARIDGAGEIPPLIDSVQAAVRREDPRLTTQLLVRLGRRAKRLAPIQASSQEEGSDLFATAGSLARRAEQAAVLAAGIAIEATVEREVFAAGDTVRVSVAVFNRGIDTIAVVGGRGPQSPNFRPVDSDMPHEGRAPFLRILPDSVGRYLIRISAERPTLPFWLDAPRSGDMFARATGQQDTTVGLFAALRLGGGVVTVALPVVYRYADPVRGEIQHPVAVVPAVSVALEHAIGYARVGAPIDRVVRAELRSGRNAEQRVAVRVRTPAGVTAAPVADVVLPPLGRRTVDIALRGQLAEGTHQIEVVAEANGQQFRSGYTEIDYEHIRPNRIYRDATLTIRSVAVSVPQVAVGYVQGVSDNVLPSLRELGVNVVAIDPATLGSADLSRFGTIVVGPRAYESSDALVANNARLLDYVRDGGRLVVQYGQYEMTQPGMMPYPITIARPHDRVTDENAPVSMIGGQVLAAPNRIGAKDWEGWVQERSLYMPRGFDPRYVPSLEMHDPGEPENRGALLVARYGEGTYVYTTLAIFRQLPAGVPGAARLFLNMLVADANAPATTSTTP
ncbi:MAG TPA: PIG-L family deacetylase [Gemmatimonadaceae bacterium]|nr:PIG-L family deacetylase [Gemmatimonadaceae bacterium]